MPDLFNLAETAEKYWPQKKGLIFCLLAIIVLEAPLFGILGFSKYLNLILLLVSIVIVILTWFYMRRIPKTKKNKVGFVVSIYCEDEVELKKIKEDFIKSLRKLIIDGITGHTFQFIEIPVHVSKDIIDVEDAQKLRTKTKSHFLIYGRVRLRNIGGENRHHMELDGIVSHRIVDEGAKAKLVEEFSELLPRRVTIQQENDLLAFSIYNRVGRTCC